MGARPEGPMGGGAGRRGGGGRGMRRGGGRGMRRGGGRGMRGQGASPMTPEQRQTRRENLIQRLMGRADRVSARAERVGGRAAESEKGGEMGRAEMQRARSERLREKANRMRSRAERMRSRPGTPPPTAGPTPQPTSEQVSAPIGYASDGTPVARSNNDVEPLPQNPGSYQAGTTGIENVTNAAPGFRLHRDAAFRGPRNAEHAQRLAERRRMLEERRVAAGGPGVRRPKQRVRPGGGAGRRMVRRGGGAGRPMMRRGGKNPGVGPVGRSFPGYTQPGGGVDPSLIGTRGPKPPANKERGVKYGDVPRKTGRQFGRSRATRRFR